MAERVAKQTAVRPIENVSAALIKVAKAATRLSTLQHLKQKVLVHSRGPLLFTAPHGICLCREGDKNHAKEEFTTEIAVKLAELCGGSFVVWNDKVCQPADEANLDPNYLRNAQLMQSPWHRCLLAHRARFLAPRRAKAAPKAAPATAAPPSAASRADAPGDFAETRGGAGVGEKPPAESANGPLAKTAGDAAVIDEIAAQIAAMGLFANATPPLIAPATHTGHERQQVESDKAPLLPEADSATAIRASARVRARAQAWASITSALDAAADGQTEAVSDHSALLPALPAILPPTSDSRPTELTAVEHIHSGLSISVSASHTSLPTSASLPLLSIAKAQQSASASLALPSRTPTAPSSVSLSLSTASYLASPTPLASPDCASVSVATSPAASFPAVEDSGPDALQRRVDPLDLLPDDAPCVFLPDQIPFHVDIHGKVDRRTAGPNTIDLGIMPLSYLWRGKRAQAFCEALRSTMAAELRAALQPSGYAVNEHPSLHGYWGGDRHTVSSQSVRLGVPAVQLELPTCMRRDLESKPELMHRLARAVVNTYITVVSTMDFEPRIRPFRNKHMHWKAGGLIDFY